MRTLCREQMDIEVRLFRNFFILCGIHFVGFCGGVEAKHTNPILHSLRDEPANPYAEILRNLTVSSSFLLFPQLR